MWLRHCMIYLRIQEDIYTQRLCVVLGKRYGTFNFPTNLRHSEILQKHNHIYKVGCVNIFSYSGIYKLRYSDTCMCVCVDAHSGFDIYCTYLDIYVFDCTYTY